ncbi:MAG: hypothetical protein OEO23_02580 [Gemmatimonadota bacterium]|nr:hypothetical protein [Gemmatimonadota bacterium]
MATTSLPDQRRAKKLLQTEARWIQRVLFGLGKAQEAREKYAEIQGEDPGPIEVNAKKGLVTLEDLRAGLEKRAGVLVENMAEEQRRTMGNQRASAAKTRKGTG